MDRRTQASGKPVRSRAVAGERARLAELKRAIQEGEYETPEKLEHALRNLLADLRSVRLKARVSHAGGSGGERP